ncbi:MAG: hypothetical protein HC820_06230 [Hydrococcus sp. RM1_1_31]|nr:hypothetical protein [Hydrococcus sp. RM1_1_31]
MSKQIIVRVSAVLLTCLSFWGNYHVITEDRDFERLTKEKLYLVNHQIELEDCSKNRERLETSIAVGLYREILAETIECVKDNENKMPSISYFYSENFLENLFTYQRNLALINPNFFTEKTLQDEIDLLLQEYEIVFSIFEGSFLSFKLEVFLLLLIGKYFLWLWINCFFIVISGVLLLGAEELEELLEGEEFEKFLKD